MSRESEYIKTLERDLAECRKANVDLMKQALRKNPGTNIVVSDQVKHPTFVYTEEVFQRARIADLEYMAEKLQGVYLESVDYWLLIASASIITAQIDVWCFHLTGPSGDEAHSQIKRLGIRLGEIFTRLKLDRPLSFKHVTGIDHALNRINDRLIGCEYLNDGDNGTYLQQIADRTGTESTLGLAEISSGWDYGGLDPMEYTDYIAMKCQPLKVRGLAYQTIAHMIMDEIRAIPPTERTPEQNATFSRYSGEPATKWGEITKNAWHNWRRSKRGKSRINMPRLRS